MLYVWWIDHLSPVERAAEWLLWVAGQSICLPDTYVKFELPPDTPTYVSIGVDIKDIPKVSDKDFSVTLNAYFIVKWKDPRIIVRDSRNASLPGQPPFNMGVNEMFSFFDFKENSLADKILWNVLGFNEIFRSKSLWIYWKSSTHRKGIGTILTFKIFIHLFYIIWPI